MNCTECVCRRTTYDPSKNIQYSNRTYAVKYFYSPTCKSELQWFMNFVSQFQIFIKGFSNIEELFLDLLQEDTDWSWNRMYLRKFNSLKKFLCKKPILLTPNLSKPYTLTVNASAYGVGSILTQEKNEVDMPVAYFSKYLDERERWHNRHEREYFAIYYSILNFQPYLEGQTFNVVSSCPLVAQERYSGNGLLGWADFCRQNEIHVIYSRSGLGECAEALSHNPVPTTLVNS